MNNPEFSLNILKFYFKNIKLIKTPTFISGNNSEPGVEARLLVDMLAGMPSSVAFLSS